jgi:tyrosine-protein kinase Etk/Wzc
MVQEQNEGRKITVKDFVFKYIHYIPLFIISVIISLTTAYLYLRYTTPVYNAQATMLIKNDNNGSKSKDDLQSLLTFQQSNNVNNEIQLLKSRTLSSRVVKALDLQYSYYNIGNIKTSIIYPSSSSPFKMEIIKTSDSTKTIGFNVTMISGSEFSLGEKGPVHLFNKVFQLDNDFIKLSKPDTFFARYPYKDYQVTWTPLQDAASNIASALTVGQINEMSDVLQLNFKTILPKIGIDVLNTLMIQYREANVEDRNQIASRTITFINDRLSIITNELGDVEKNLQQFKQSNKVVDLQAQSEIFLNNQGELEKQLTTSEVELSVIQYLRDYMSSKNNEFNIVPSSLNLNDPTLIQLVRVYNELQLRRESELKTTTPENQLILNLESQLQKLRADIQETLKNQYAAVKKLNENAKVQIRTYTSTLGTVPLKEKELLEITRQQGIKQQLYLYLLQKREETAISLASTISNSQVVDPATCINIPAEPKPLNIKIIGLLAGLLLPAAFIYIKELLNDKVNSRNDIQKVTDAPIFGEIGHSNDDKVLVVQNNQRNSIAEQFRVIRTNLQYMLNKNDRSVILVTSTFSGEGKTFVSINIGAVMALAGKKTVILEFDIRKPKILTGLQMTKAEGITNFLVGKNDIEKMLLPVSKVDNLFVLPCGPIPPNPAEILLDERLNDLFAYLKQNFEIVIIDTAPIGLVSDAQILSRFADCTLHVVRLNYTLKKQIQFINELYISSKMPKMALLVNDIKGNTHYYSYGNTGGYGYGYGYGMEEKQGRFARWWSIFKKPFGKY